MPRVFISYRRESGWALAGRVYDMLIEKFGKENVFIDIDDIEPGEDFAAVLEDTLLKVDAILPIIDRDWANIKDEEGNRRLDSSNDFVRREIATALRRNIFVLPVLEPNTKIPAISELPEDIQELARLNALWVSQKHFRADVDRIAEMLETLRSEADFAHLGRHREAAVQIVADETERTRWERNYWIADAIWAPAIGGPMGWHTMRAPILERLERLDLSTDSELEAARDELKSLIRQAPQAEYMREKKDGSKIEYDLKRTPEMTILLDEIDEAIRVRGKLACETAYKARKREFRDAEPSEEELKRWRRNWKIHQSIFVGGLGSPDLPFGRWFICRELLLDRLARMDFSTDPELEAKRKTLVAMINAAPDAEYFYHGTHYDLLTSPEMELLRGEIDRAIEERGEVAEDLL
jgi:hypothetical protein